MRQLAGALNAPTAPPAAAAAARMASDLVAELARLNVPTWPLSSDSRHAAVSLWYGLIVYTDGARIWWQRPQASARGRALATYAHTAETAAGRLAADYQQARTTYPDPWRAGYLAASPAGDEAPTD